MGFTYKRGSTWWIAFKIGQILHRESARTKDEEEAERYLKIAEGKAAEHGIQPLNAKTIPLSELLRYVVQDYEREGYVSIGVVRRRIDNHIAPYFGGIKAVDLTTPHINNYIHHRQHPLKPDQKPASNADVNRDLAIIKRGYSLAHKYGLQIPAPYVPMLQENNARQVFISPAEMASILAALARPSLRPELNQAVAAAVETGYITGWRINSEILPLEWNRVDFEAGWITVLKTKNKKPRAFYMTTRLREILENQRRITNEFERSTGRIVPYVFHWKGRRIGRFYKTWHSACVASGNAGKVPHDNRRSAARNLTRAGVSEGIAQKVTGHLSNAVFKRYNITDEPDLVDASQKLEEYSQFNHNEATSKVSRFRK